MPDTLVQLTDELRTHLTAARDIAAKAEAESRDFTATERADITDRLSKAAPLRGRIEQAKGDADMRRTIADLGDNLGDGIALLDPADKPTLEPNRFARRKRGRTVGQEFVEAAEYKAFLAQFPGGEIPSKARVQSLPVGFKSLFTGTDDHSAGVFVEPDRTGLYEPLGRRPLTLRSLLSSRSTTSDTVEYVRQLSRVNAAAPVPEATTAAGPKANTTTGALELPAGSGIKPEGGFTFEKVTESVRTFAEWIPATRRAMADAPQIRGMIDQELSDDLAELEEAQFLLGDGTGENVTGILHTSGLQMQAWDTDEFVTTRKARRKVRQIGRSVATAYLMNPEDWERIDLKRDGEQRFYGAGPFAVGTPTLWGLPVVESEIMPLGVALCADWRKAVVWDREQANISVTDSHADFFIRNLLAILAEERLAFGVIRPPAFVQIDLTA